jgi:hypothetical protein
VPGDAQENGEIVAGEKACEVLARRGLGARHGVHDAAENAVLVFGSVGPCRHHVRELVAAPRRPSTDRHTVLVQDDVEVVAQVTDILTHVTQEQVQPLLTRNSRLSPR